MTHPELGPFGATALEFARAGYSPVPTNPRGKGPVVAEWQTFVDPDEHRIEAWRQQYPRCNVGLVMGRRIQLDGTNWTLTAVDIDADDLVQPTLMALGLQDPGAATGGDTAELPCGKVGKKGLTIFALADAALPSKKLKRRDATGQLERKPSVEFLGVGTQTIVPPSIHPDTHQPYRWIGRSLLEVPPTALPRVTREMFDEIAALVAGAASSILALNEMVWLGVGGGGTTHDSCVAAVAWMVHRGWADQAIHSRIEQAKRQACARAAMVYDWPGSSRAIQEWIDSARNKGMGPPPDEESAPDAGHYRVVLGRLCRERVVRNVPVLEPLCNFTAEVTEELVLDDGAETTRAFTIQGQLDSGVPLPPIRVPVASFGQMNWVTAGWGVRAIIRAGLAMRDCLREAIQRLSPHVRYRHVYTHTGWREINGTWTYLTAEGALNQDGIEVDLGPTLSRYRLPREAEDSVGGMRASLAFLRLAPLRITVPIWAAMFRAPLAVVFPPDVSVWIEGTTGSLKSTLAGVAMAHFGPFDRTHLPAAWSSTANQLERAAFLVKDAPLVIDDWAPTGLDRREMETKAARLLRAQGNLAGRGRLRADLTDRPAFPPRGIILATGEQHPPGQSILARAILVDLERGDVDLLALTEAQKQADRLPHAMAGYLRWLAPQIPTLQEQLAQQFAATRATLHTYGQHLRIPEAIAHLYLGLDWGLRYAEVVGACSAEQAEALRQEARDALIALGHSQGQIVETERPTRRFLSVLLALVVQEKADLRLRTHPDLPRVDRTELLGWQDADFLYVIPEGSYKMVTRFCLDSNEPFPVAYSRLIKDLQKDGLTECDENRHTKSVRFGKETKRLLKFRRDAVARLLGEDFPTVTEVIDRPRWESRDHGAQP